MDKSLLHWEADQKGRGRYQIHELLRQFAEEKLQEHMDDTAQVMAQHCRYYAQFTDQREDDLLGGRQQAAMAEIEAELNNIRAAWQWAIEQKEMTALLQIGNPLTTFYWHQTRFQEARVAYGAAVDCLEAIPASSERDLALAAMLTNLGWFEQVLGKTEYGVMLAKRSLAIYLDLDAPPFPGLDTDPRLILGLVYRFKEGKVTESIQCLEEVLAETERRPHLTNEQTAHRLLAQTYHYIDELEPALEHVLIAYNLSEQMEDKLGKAYNLETLGRIALSQGDYEAAEQQLQVCYDLQVELGFGQGTADVCMQLTDLALRRKNRKRARQYAQEGLALYQRSKTSYGELGMMARLAHTALLGEEYELVRKQILETLEKGMEDPANNQDVKLYTVAIAADTRLQIGGLLPAIDWLAFAVSQPYLYGVPRIYAGELFEQWQGELDSTSLNAVIDRAARQSLEILLVEIKADFFTPFTVGQAEEERLETKTAAAANQELVEPLTNRELEVLQLIADGLTNRQIADELIISTGTVKYYSSHIYGKLQVNNRTQAVAVAREMGLIYK